MIAKHNRGFSLVELLIVIAIMLVLAAIVLPNVHMNQMLANETAAGAQMRSILTTQAQYYAEYRRYATSLAEFGPPASGAPGPSAAALMSADLARGKKSGYTYVLQGTPTGFTLTAVPDVYNGTGRKSLFADETQTIRESTGPETATAASPEIGTVTK